MSKVSLSEWRAKSRLGGGFAGLAALGVSLALVVAALDVGVLRATLLTAVRDPLAILAVLTCYALAFALRAGLWRRVLPGLSLSHALAALHVALAGNHVLPLRLGEALRVTSVVRRARIPVAPAVASTVTLRAADVLAVVGLIAVLGPAALARVASGWGAVVLLTVALVGAAGVAWLWRLRRNRGIALRLPGPLVAVGAVAAWALEAVVLWQAAAWAGIALGPGDALLVTAVTIAAQIVAVAPGGVGTYEAAATGALVALGAAPGPALAAAVTAHLLKTVYALLTGAVALLVPAPGMFGRLRLPSARPARPAPAPPPADAPVVLFLPAHNEAESVGTVVRRTPASVFGRPVRCLVIDDGSTDGTACVAAAAGATVVRQPANLGLGAAVRRGLAEGVGGGAAAVAFCDADGEYAPEELERLVAPILAGAADYVVGSRFTGRIGRMRPHRRLGNRLLTSLLAVIARAPITDGQSGYRAFSAAAAADAEIVHDFNYAQVLTLDLLAKGWRYHEVPISYTFRTTGRSFVRLGRYLRHVVPAIHRELNPA